MGPLDQLALGETVVFFPPQTTNGALCLMGGVMSLQENCGHSIFDTLICQRADS